MFSALDIQDELQTLYTSGTVFHAFLGEKLPDWKAAATLVRKIAENYKLPYYTMSPTYSVCKDHGYLTGEQFTCPHCGEKTEVYSRITGYYRPVQNWNDGKTQEYKDRQVYNIGHSVLTHSGPNPAAAANAPEKTEAEKIVDAQIKEVEKPSVNVILNETTPKADGVQAILFKTATCPNCKAAGALLDRAGVSYRALNADEEKELVEKFGIRQAPTLVLVNGDSFEKYRGVSDIKGWLMSR